MDMGEEHTMDMKEIFDRMVSELITELEEMGFEAQATGGFDTDTEAQACWDLLNQLKAIASPAGCAS